MGTSKVDKLVTSLSQLLINYYRYRVKMNMHQTIKTSKNRQTTKQQALCKATWINNAGCSKNPRIQF